MCSSDLDFLANDVTRQAPGGSAPAPYGYQGETGAPGGNSYRFTLETAANAGDTSIQVTSSFDLPVPGQYIEFGGTPVHNATYQITSVNTATRTISFDRVPGPAGNGLDFAAAAGTAINFTNPAAVKTIVEKSAGPTSDITVLPQTAGDTTVLVLNIAGYTVGDRIEFGSDPGTFYDVTGVDSATNLISVRQHPSGGGLATGIPTGDTISITHGYAPGDTLITLSDVTGLSAGQAVKFSNSSATYSVVSVNTSTNQIQITAEGTAQGVGLDTYLAPPTPGEPGGEATAQFGEKIDALQVRIDNGIDLQYGLRADNPAIRKMLSMAMWMALIVAPVQAFIGDMHGLNTLKHQPAKIAAMEGVFETERSAPLLLLAWPNEPEGRLQWSIGVPKLASLILTHRLDGEIKGLNEFKGAHPPVAPLFYGFRIMVGMGVLMLMTSWGAWWILRRARWNLMHVSQRWVWPLLSAMTFSGWVATEIGRAHV